MPSRVSLTRDAPPEVVWRVATALSRRYEPWGALEQADYRSIACLAFYEGRHMIGAIREARHREARQHRGYEPPVRVPRAPAPPTAQRQAQRREHNRTYYYRTVGLQACDGCGALVERGHGARRCDACVSPSARRLRERRRQSRMAA